MSDLDNMPNGSNRPEDNFAIPSPEELGKIYTKEKQDEIFQNMNFFPYSDAGGTKKLVQNEISLVEWWVVDQYIKDYNSVADLIKQPNKRNTPSVFEDKIILTVDRFDDLSKKYRSDPMSIVWDWLSHQIQMLNGGCELYGYGIQTSLRDYIENVEKRMES